jgi:hypothetical protein
LLDLSHPFPLSSFFDGSIRDHTPSLDPHPIQAFNFAILESRKDRKDQWYLFDKELKLPVRIGGDLYDRPSLQVRTIIYSDAVHPGAGAVIP